MLHAQDLHIEKRLACKRLAMNATLDRRKKERLSLYYRRRRTQEHVDFLRRRQQCNRSFFSFKGTPLRGS